MRHFEIGTAWTFERAKLVVVSGEPKIILSTPLQLTVRAVQAKQIVFVEPGGKLQPISKIMLKKFRKAPDDRWGFMQILNPHEDGAVVATYATLTPALDKA